MLNHCVLQGRFGKDPELRTTQNGKSVVSFSLAVDRDFKGQDGQKVTDWIDIVTFGPLAEHVSRYFHKGSMAVVSGRLQMRPWTDKDGNKRIAAEVVADNVYFGSSKSESGSSNTAGSGESSRAVGQAAPAPAPFAELNDDNGEIPF